MTETHKYRVYTLTDNGRTGHTVVDAEDKDSAAQKALRESPRMNFVEVADVEEYEEGHIRHPAF